LKEDLMTKMILVNLPVAKLAASKRFYQAVGSTNHAQLTDDSAGCMVWSESINVLLHTHVKWRRFTNRSMPPVKSSEVMLALSCDSRDTVDDMNKAAAANGGTADINPAQDRGLMYNRSLADPGGHICETVWMDPAAIPSDDQKKKLRKGSGRNPMTTNPKRLSIRGHSATSRRCAVTLLAVILWLQGGLSQAAETAAPPAMSHTASAPAGQYQLDKSHASLLVRVNHLGFSTYTTRFSRFNAELRFDPSNIPASKVVTTIDASSFEMDAAPPVCLDIVKGPKLLDTVKFPQIVFKSERVRMTGAKSMEVSGTLTLRGVTRPMVLTATFNGGYPGMPNMDPHARVGFSAHGSFKRSDFGMAFGIPASGTTMGVGDMIDFSIEAEFTGPPLASPAEEAH
jgi:polyisoprenoid-binding protein YceI/predicted lactoylglutathione lyase